MQKKFIVKMQGLEQACASVEDLLIGDKVIVDNGGSFIGVVSNISSGDGGEMPMVLRKATTEDLKKDEENNLKIKEVLLKAKKICRSHNREMKVLTAQFSLLCEKLVLTFSSENRVDFRELVKELATVFKTRIELKQVGMRDEAKLIGGLGPCGMQCCCNRCLKEPPFTGIKMAKTQNLSLSPQKINGLCGKIMCCVSYENEHYTQTLKSMPRINAKVSTPDGKGCVTGHDCLRCRVNVRVPKNEDGFEIKNYPLNELKFEREAEHFSDEED